MNSPLTSSDRRWWALGVLSITQLMVTLDATVINIALPHAQRDLHFTIATVSGSSRPTPSHSVRCC